MGDLIEEINEWVHNKNRNIIIIITGRPGTGKSYVSLNLAESLDPKFFKEPFQEQSWPMQERVEHLGKRVKFLPEDFITTLSDDKKLYPGSVVIMEEAGLQISADEWQSFITKTITKIFQIFRYKHIIVIMTVPQLNYIAKKVRSRIQYQIETLDVEGNENITKVKVVEWNDEREMFYKKFLVKDGYKLNPYIFPRADIKLINAYEKLADSMKSDLMAEMARDAREAQAVRKQEAKRKKLKSEEVEDIVEQIKEEGKIKPEIRRGKVYYNLDKIRYYYGIPHTVARLVKMRLEETSDDIIEKRRKEKERKRRKKEFDSVKW